MKLSVSLSERGTIGDALSPALNCGEFAGLFAGRDGV